MACGCNDQAAVLFIEHGKHAAIAFDLHAGQWADVALSFPRNRFATDVTISYLEGVHPRDLAPVLSPRAGAKLVPRSGRVCGDKQMATRAGHRRFK